MTDDANTESFSVSIHYRLTEYFSFLQVIYGANIGMDVVQKRSFKAVAYPIWFAIYCFKILREGKCTFTFHADGFSRKSRSGQSEANWERLDSVLFAEQFYLLVGKRKAMAPLPKRVFTFEQIQKFEAWTQHKSTLEITANLLSD